jgi:CHAT domain-containing protein
VQAQTLLDRLPEATILHLACHGIQDAETPLNSGFVMSDGILTISKLIGVSSSRAFLAFLSACGTAKGDKVRGVW